MLKLSLQYFGYLMWTVSSLEKTLMLVRIEGKRRRWQQRIWWLDSITNSLDVNLNKLWETWRIGKPGVLQSMGSHRVGYNLGTEQQQLWILMFVQGFLDGSVSKNPPAMQETKETRNQSLGWEDPLEEEMATHSIGGIFVYKVLCVFNYLGYVSVPRSGIAGPYNSSLFKIWGNASLFSRVGLPFYIAISSVWGSQCSAFSLVAACPFDCGHLSGCGWISHYSFDWYFPCGQCCSASFYVLLGHWHVFFRKISVQIFDLLKFDYLSFYYWVIRVLMYSKMRSDSQSCLTFCDPMICSLPGSSVLRILLPSILKWDGISQLRDRTCASCVPYIGMQSLYR